MRYLNTLDYTVIAIYSLILVGMAVYLKRIASRSLEDYFLAGRKLPWWALGVSGMTNFLDMTGTMVIVSFLFMLGPRGLYIEFRGGAVLVLAFMMLWTGKWHYRSQCMTGAEWNIFRYGSSAGAQLVRILTVVFGTISTVGMLAYLIKGAGLFLSMFMPFSPLVCALLMVTLTTLYTLISGFYGVVYTDLFQSGIILISVIVISTMAVMQIMGYDGNLATLAMEVTQNKNWTSSIPQQHTNLFKGYEQFEPLFMLAGAYLLRNVLGGLSTGADPRYFGARNERECGLLTFFWTWLMTFRWPMMMGFAVLGLFLVKDMFPDQSVLARSAELIKQSPEVIQRHGTDLSASRWEDVTAGVTGGRGPEQYPQLTAQLQALLGNKWEEKVLLVGFEGTVNPERILPAVILMRIPMGIRGLFLVSLVAAAMSTFSPTVNMTIALFTRDIYQAFMRPKAPNKELIFASYGFGILLVLGGMGLAYTTKSINDIWDWIIMGLGSGVIIPGILRLYWWRFNAGGANMGTAIGLAAAVIQRIVFPEWGPQQKFAIVTAISLVGAITGTYLFPPTERHILEHFYKITRPFGLWGPLKKTLAPEVRQAMTREHFYDIAATPFALLWQITLFLLPMQLIIGNFRDFGITLIFFLVGLIGVYLLWYRHLPPATVKAGEAFNSRAEVPRTT